MKDLFRMLFVILLVTIAAAAQSKPAAENKQQGVVFAGNEYKQQADKALQEKRFDDAIRLFEKAADAGDGNALLFLGDVYYIGKLRAQDFQKARSYYEKAETMGYLGAERANNLGLIYADGLGVKPDDKRAFQLFERSAKGGYSWGMTNLGLRYEQGLGVAQDHTLAREWFEKAAAKGNEAAKKLLAKMSQ